MIFFHHRRNGVVYSWCSVEFILFGILFELKILKKMKYICIQVMQQLILNERNIKYIIIEWSFGDLITSDFGFVYFIMNGYQSKQLPKERKIQNNYEFVSYYSKKANASITLIEMLS